MKADYLTYKRAIEASILGLVVQLVLGLTLLISGVVGGDQGAVSGSILILVGVIGWVMLAIVFDQHRRERLEALEAESLASVDTASVFEEGATDLKVAARRLKTMHRIVVPIVSVLMGGAYIALGIWRYQGAKSLDRDTPISTHPEELSLAIAVAVAFFGFVLARYVAGMGKQRAWSNLRAGASASAGMAVVGLLLSAGYLAELASSDAMLRVLRYVFPIAMVVLGSEVLIRFLLDLYRPRIPGEVPRPAFDSRLLGWIAAPDKVAQSIGGAINYQFGSDVASSWQYQLIARSAGWLVAMAILVMWGLTSLAVVQPDQRGMILRFGEIVRADVGPGLHLKLPWPIDELQIPEQPMRDEKGRRIEPMHTVTGVRRLHVGTQPPADKSRAILWTEPHTAGEKERHFMVRPSRDNASARHGSVSGGDIALLAAEIPIEYAVRDVEAFERMAPPEMRDGLLHAVAERAAMLFFSTKSVDDLLSDHRPESAIELQEQIQAAFESLARSLGLERSPVEALAIGLQGVHPPRDVADSFGMLEEAQQRYFARLDRAEAEAIGTLTRAAGNVQIAEEIARAGEELNRMKEQSEGVTPEEIVRQQQRLNELLNEAGGEVASMLAKARADRWRTHLTARGQAERYAGRLEGYQAAPEIYKATLYFEALADALFHKRLYVASDARPFHLRVEAQDEETALSVFGEATRARDQQ